jgi:hypothetical protein
MAVLDRPDQSPQQTNLCAAKFCLTWVGFFVVLGILTYLVSLL